MGCDNAWHLCAITSANNSHVRRTRSWQVSRLQNSKVPEHLADPPVHADCNRNSWRMEHGSKRIHQRTWETYYHSHRGCQRDKLYLPTNLSVNSERQHAVSFMGHSPQTRTSISIPWVASLTSFNLNFKACRLRAGGRKNKNNIIIITILLLLLINLFINLFICNIIRLLLIALLLLITLLHIILQHV